MTETNENKDKTQDKGTGLFYTTIVLLCVGFYFAYKLTAKPLLIYISIGLLTIGIIYRFIFDGIHHTYPWSKTEEMKRKEEEKRLEKERERQEKIRLKQRKKRIKQWLKEGKDIDDFIELEKAELQAEREKSREMEIRE